MKTGASVLVTGASGFIGSRLVDRLARVGATVFTLSRTPAPASSGPGFRGGEIRPLLLPQPATTAALRATLAPVSPEVVFHLASAGVSPGDNDPQALFDGNAGLMVSLLRALAGKGVRSFVYTGSCAEYALVPAGSLIAETAPLGGRSLYGAAKAAAGLYGAALAVSLSIPFFHLRLFGVYGPGEGPLRLIPYLARKLANREPVDLTPGEQVRDLTHVDDIVEALLLAGAGDALPPLCNVCSARPVTVRAVGAMVAQALGAAPELLHWGARPYRESDHPWIVGDNRLFAQATGWAPQTDLAEGIRGVLSHIVP